MPGIDVLADLIEASWEPEGGQRVSFPTTDISTSFDHDIARHKYWKKNGASLEETGRNPFRTSLTIPFRVGIVKGPGESWSGLYPGAFDRFIAAAAEGKRGFLTHPHFGLRRCYVVSVEVKWTSARRDGCDVTASWEEDEDDLFEERRGDAASDLYAASRTLETSGEDIASLAPTLPEVTPDLLDQVNAVLSTVNAVRAAQLRAAGKIAAIRQTARRIGNAVSAVRNLVDPNGDPDDRRAAKRALLWPVAQSAATLEAAANDLDGVANASARRVSVYTTRRPQTLAQVAADIGAPIGEIMSLNPRLLSRPVVPESTGVRYYS